MWFLRKSCSFLHSFQLPGHARSAQLAIFLVAKPVTPKKKPPEGGFFLGCVGAQIFTGLLIALSGIDLDHQILPDNLTLPGMWLGLVVNLGGTFTDPVTALIGAMAGYLSLWSVYQAFRLLTGKEGMGYGDFKLLALIGAWLGWTHLPGAILIGSLLGALIGSVALHVSGRNRQTPIPFGPFLAAGGWIMLIAGDFLNRGYLNLSGMA